MVAVIAVAFTLVNVALLISWWRTATQTNAAHERERLHWHRERAELLNRIKPETAQPLPGETPKISHPAISTDDDGAYWRARGHEVN